MIVWELYCDALEKGGLFSSGFIWIRGVTIPGLESESESDFHNFLGINDSNSDSDSSKNWFSYCTGIDSKMDSILIPIRIPIPVKNGIVTPLIWIRYIGS